MYEQESCHRPRIQKFCSNCDGVVGFHARLKFEAKVRAKKFSRAKLVGGVKDEYFFNML